MASAGVAGSGDIVPPGSASKLDATSRVGSWIWADKTFDGQTCRFWRSFEIPSGASVVKARLRITADNSYWVFLDGLALGRGSEWKTLAQHDLTQVLGPGVHVLAVEAFNDYASAGLLVGLRIGLRDGRLIEVASDDSWRIAPDDERRWNTRKSAATHWPAAKVVAALGGGVWAGQQPVRVVREQFHQAVTFDFWRSDFLQISLLSLCGLAILVCLRLVNQIYFQRQAQVMLERERARIARDIHDDLGAGLTQLVVSGEVAQNQFACDSAARAILHDQCAKGRSLLTSIDEVVWTVNSRRDTLRDFESFVCGYAEKFFQRSSIRCRLKTDEELPEAAFDLAARRNLFLAIKEALNNAARHSGATELFVRIQLRGQQLAVEIEDNGKGFEAARADDSRNGLSNMAQRMAEVGGVCQVITQPGAGCRIVFTAPVAHARGASRLWPWRRASRVQINPLATDPSMPAPEGAR